MTRVERWVWAVFFLLLMSASAGDHQSVGTFICLLAEGLLFWEWYKTHERSESG